MQYVFPKRQMQDSNGAVFLAPQIGRNVQIQLGPFVIEGKLAYGLFGDELYYHLEIYGTSDKVQWAQVTFHDGDIARLDGLMNNEQRHYAEQAGQETVRVYDDTLYIWLKR